jgi:hypothetical protein
VAQSRFSALLQRVRLFFSPGAESELRQEVGHQFNVSEAIPIGRVGHQFALGTESTDELGHEFDVNQINVDSILFHEFDVNQINTSANVGHEVTVSGINTIDNLEHSFGVASAASGLIGHEFDGVLAGASGLFHEFEIPNLNFVDELGHEFDIPEINASGLLGHGFGVAAPASGLIGHQFQGALVASGLLSHEFDVNQINVSDELGHTFDIDGINTIDELNHQFAVKETTTSGLSHEFAVQQDGISELGHEFDVDHIDTSVELGHEFDIPQINVDSQLGHSFGNTNLASGLVGMTFGMIEPNSLELGHTFGIYGIIATSGLFHEFNIPEIGGTATELGHSFGMGVVDSGRFAHQFLLDFPASGLVGHEFTISGIDAFDPLGHEFLLNVDLYELGHSFSAIGAGVLTDPISHEFEMVFIQPSYVLTHQFRAIFELDFVVTTHSGDFRFIHTEGTDPAFDLLVPYNHIWGDDTSYASRDVNTLSTSTGTWTHIDPGQVVPSVASGLYEADFFHGSWVFNAEPENLVRAVNYNPSGEVTTIPEVDSDTIYLRQAWHTPVSTSGEMAFWNLNDFPTIPDDSFNLLPAEELFPPFFGRQITISGVMREHWGFFGLREFPTTPDYDVDDPIVLYDTTDVIFTGDPFTFYFEELFGDVKRILEKDFTISGIYISKPNGEPGTVLRPDDTVVRLGFTFEDSDYQPELLQWKLGVELPAGTYDQIISTDQWLANGFYRDFVVAELQRFDDVCGQIRAYSPEYNTEFTGYPPEIIQMSSEDSVFLRGGGITIWPNYFEEEAILELCVEVLAARLRNNIPTLLKIREEGTNSLGKMVRIYNASGIMQGEHIVAPYNAVLGAKVGDLIIDTKSDSTYTIASNTISEAAIAVYRLESSNKIGKWALLDEESE